MTGATQILWSMTAMAALGVAVFFIRFWYQSRDRLFLLFSAAMLLLAAHWIILAALDVRDESRHMVYVIRLASFVLILLAILDKNRTLKDEDAPAP